MTWFNDDLDRIDAAVFSGDALESLDNRKELKAMCERWLRAIKDHEARDFNDLNLSLFNPICPRCQKPVLFEHSSTSLAHRVQSSHRLMVGDLIAIAKVTYKVTQVSFALDHAADPFNTQLVQTARITKVK